MAREEWHFDWEEGFPGLTMQSCIIYNYQRDKIIAEVFPKSIEGTWRYLVIEHGPLESITGKTKTFEKAKEIVEEHFRKCGMRKIPTNGKVLI